MPAGHAPAAAEGAASAAGGGVEPSGIGAASAPGDAVTAGGGGVDGPAVEVVGGEAAGSLGWAAHAANGSATAALHSTERARYTRSIRVTRRLYHGVRALPIRVSSGSRVPAGAGRDPALALRRPVRGWSEWSRNLHSASESRAERGPRVTGPRFDPARAPRRSRPSRSRPFHRLRCAHWGRVSRAPRTRASAWTCRGSPRAADRCPKSAGPFPRL